MFVLCFLILQAYGPYVGDFCFLHDGRIRG